MKKRLLLTALTFSFFGAQSQTNPSDGCTGVPSLAVGATCGTPNTFTLAGSYSNGALVGASCTGNNRDDGWYSFTATSTSTAIDLTADNRNATLAVWSACGGGTELGCTNIASGTSGTLTITTVASTTYYIQIHRNSGNNTASMTGDICVYEATPPPAVQGDDECNPIVISAGTTCSYTTYDNSSNSSSSTAPAPGCANFSGTDIWFALEIPASGNLTFDTQAGVITDAGMAVYTGADCSSLTLVDCDDDGGTGTMSNIVATGLTPGDTVYIRVWEYGGDNNGTFDLCVVDNCPSGAPGNNLPCSATSITVGGSATGENNSCADGTSDPATPGCWTAGSSNTLWYSFTAPASGEAQIGITNGSLASSQIAVFSGTCGSLSLVSCSTTATGAGCAGASVYDTDIALTGLTAGDTYFIAIDGQNSNVGTFDVVVLGSTPTVIPGQDCSVPIPICNSIMSIGDPGYANTGNVCDFDGSQDCTGGEKNSVWYQIDILLPGSLNFTIMPNDGNNTSCGAETDYDFVIWRTVSGTGADPVQDCSTLSSDNAAIVACNYNADGVTGVAAGGNAPAPISNCFDAAFEPTINVSAGDQYVLVVQNFSGSTQGFTLDLTGSGVGVVDYTGTPTNVAWTGGTDTDWEDSNNWGSCASPTCGIGAIVIGGITNQPVLTGTHNVNDVTINPGATLTLAAGAVLNVCGDFENNGTLTADPTSTINFIGTGVDQTISGNLTGANAFGNLTVNKLTNTVIFNSNIEIAGTFTTSNATSIIDANDLTITCGGDVNLAAPGTLTDVDNGEFVFNGSAAQSYTTNGDLFLNNVTINGTQVNMNDNVICDTDGILTLSNGIFVTGGSRVELNNINSNATGTGSTGSYVQGNLRRYIVGSTAYDFPVGDATAGYERANVSFTTATTINYLDGRFDSWPGALPGNLGANECIAATYNMDALDNGFWTIDASNTPTSGNYDVTLYNTAGSYTNTAGAQGWTVMKNSGAGWILDGTCVITSTVNQVMRNGLNGFSLFATAQNPGSPLPIELASFTGERNGNNNVLRWTTLSENASLRFEIERSFDGINYEKIGEIDAAGNSLSLEQYMFMDFNVNSTAYYRLVLVNTDLSTELFDPIRLDVRPGENIIQIYPNPVQDLLTVQAHFDNSSLIEVYDLSGRLVLSENPNLKGAGNYNLNLEGLSKGTYILKYVYQNDRTESIRFVKK